MNPREAAAALLALVAENRAARCRGHLERAQAEADGILRAAHSEARRRMRRALEDARAGAAGRVALAEAQQRTRERAVRQREVKARLDLTWPLLGGLLRAAWSEPRTRALWAEHYARRALEVLPGSLWQVFHPAGWPRAEQQRLAELLARGAIEARLAADPALAAGLRFVSGDSVLDASERGLLADRAGIEARLLYHAEAGG